MIYCGKCGKENLDTNQFCEYCGAPLHDVSQKPVNENTQNITKNAESVDSTPTIVTVLLLIFMFPVGVIVMWIWPKWKKWVKILITLIVLIPFLFIFLGAMLLAINPRETMKLAEESKNTVILDTSTGNSRTRDTTRLSDLDVLENAIDIALTDGEITLTSTSSCITCTSDKGTQAVDGKNGWVKFDIPTGKTGLARYITSLPLDPLNSGEYIYYFESTPEGYEINAVLEDEPKMSSDYGTDSRFYEVGNDSNIR